MSLPRFGPHDDPGPSFAALLRRTGAAAHSAAGSGFALGDPGAKAASPAAVDAPHGTTCLAVRYSGGVVLAGDRRATAGHLISSHRIEKVFPADRHSGVAIAGVAGPSSEMVRLFQLQLEHYEKVEGTPISLEGKANQLAQMVRANLPAAMQGLVVVPIFAGFDLAAGRGRLFEYDITGGRYEERDYATTGSGALHAETVVKLGFRPSLGAAAATDLVLEALFVAADADSATGGPDPVRNVFPVVAAIGADGYRRLDDAELRRRTERLLGRHRSRREPAGGRKS
ncbi:MAG: proteasome subunit beta [Acidimicrobiaceae bacterium]|nr:proteasome subunit beta [Acidimicrobiaceae bacterium]